MDGYLARLRGANETQIILKNAIQLVVNEKMYEIIRRIEKYLEYNSMYEVDSKFDGLTNEDLNMVYNELYLKAKESIYRKRPTQQVQTLENALEGFASSDELSEKAQIIYNIINLFRCDATTETNLKLIGGATGAGRMKVSKNTLTSKKLYLIHQSITGLFQTEEELV